MQFGRANRLGRFLCLLLALIMVTGLFPPTAEVQATVSDSDPLASQLPNENIAAYSGDFTSNAVSDLRTSSADADRDSSSAVYSGKAWDGLLVGQSLPQSVDWSNWLPPVDEQTWDDCVSWAVVYYNMTFIKAREQGWDPKLPEHIFSPSFTYHQVGSEKGGNSVSEVMEFIKRVGAAPIAVFPYSRLEEDSQPMPWQVEQASHFKISSYEKVYDYKKDKFDEKALSKLKSLLASGNLLVITVDQDSLDFGFAKKDPNYVATLTDAHMGGCGHALVVVGYDDSRYYVDLSGNKHYGAFKLVNSWGTNWGAKGFAYVSYDWMEHSLNEAWVMYNKPTPPGFTLSVVPQSVSVAAPSESVLRVRVSRYSNFNGRVSLSAISLSEDILVTVSSTTQESQDSGLLELRVQPRAKPGKHVVQVRASSDTGVRLARIEVNVVREGEQRVIENLSFGPREWNRIGLGFQAPISSVAVHPSDVSVAYAGGADGLYKTVNGGKSWNLVFKRPFANVDFFGTKVHISQENPNDVVFIFGQSVYRTLDGGRSWHPLTSTPKNASFVAFGKDNDTFYVADGNWGLYKYVSGNWQTLMENRPKENVLPPLIRALAGSPQDANLVYVATTTCVLRSEDGGSTWQETNLRVNETATVGPNYVQSLAVSPIDPNVVYAVVRHGSWEWFLYKTTSGGKSWGVVLELGMQASAFVHVSLSNPNAVFVFGCPGVYVSKDGGNSWQHVAVRGRFHVIASSPGDPNVLYASEASTAEIPCVWKSLDGGLHWSSIGYAVSWPFSVVIDPQNSNRIIVGTDMGVALSNDGGLVFDKGLDNNPMVTVRALALHPKTSNIVFGGTFGLPVVSTNGGASWSMLYSLTIPDSGLPWRNPTRAMYVSGDSSQERIYLATADGLLEVKWNKASIEPFEVTRTALEGTYLFSVAADPRNSNRILAGGVGGVYVSSDGGISWAKSNDGLTNTLVNVLLFDPVDPARVWLGTDGSGVFVSLDGGKSWHKSGAGLENVSVTAIAVSSREPNLIFAGTENGLYESWDGGKTWHYSGLRGAKVLSLAIDYAKDLLYVGTDQSGLVTTNIGRPLAPVDFEAVPTSTSVVLSWKPSPGGRNGVRGYEVYRSTRFDLSDAVRLASLSPESLTYVDWTARPGVTYYYYAVALDSSTSENRSSLSQVVAATILEHQIHASAGVGGSISPAGAVTVPYGSNQTFTIMPNPGYRIADVIVDGKSVGAVTSYTFSNVTENHTINAVFEKAETLIVLQIGKSVFTVDGMARTLDSPPVIKNSRTLLPIRAIVEALGGQVGWDANQKKVTVTLGGKTVELWIGKNTALVNGRQVMIDATNPKVVPEIINGRTMLPLRFVAESLGCSVEWDGNTQTVRVTYQRP